MKMLAVILIFAPALASAHARFDPAGNVPPRNSSAGLKTGPCGGVARTSTPKVLQQGSMVRIDWQETVQHPGRFEIYFSQSGDTNFTLLKTIIDTKDSSTDLPHNYNDMIQLPNVVCDTCTLQLIQVMTENPASPSLYYSCADIQLQAGPGPTPTPIPSPAPMPGPSPGCH